MSFSIDGKTVIVTGAANGIGAALARHFAENGANVMCADIDEKSLKKSITKFRQDEIDHKNLAYNEGASKKGLYFLLDKIIQTTSKAAIKVSEKI